MGPLACIALQEAVDEVIRYWVLGFFLISKEVMSTSFHFLKTEFAFDKVEGFFIFLKNGKMFFLKCSLSFVPRGYALQLYLQTFLFPLPDFFLKMSPFFKGGYSCSIIVRFKLSELL